MVFIEPEDKQKWTCAPWTINFVIQRFLQVLESKEGITQIADN